MEHDRADQQVCESLWSSLPLIGWTLKGPRKMSFLPYSLYHGRCASAVLIEKGPKNEMHSSLFYSRVWLP